MADVTIDARGLQCPIPIAKISARMFEMNSGQILEIMADDLPFSQDVQAYCEVSGNELVSLEECGNCFTAIIKKA